jgi:DNA processing protein
MSDQTRYWVGLSKVQGIGPVRMRRLLEKFGDAEVAWHATHGDLVAAGLEHKIADALVETRRTTDLDREMERLQQIGARALTWESEDYPERLREVDDAPAVLYALGEFMPSDSWAVAVVGTRRATHYGREVTARLASELAEAGISIISGLPLTTPLIRSGACSNA